MSRREHYVFAYDIGDTRRQYRVRKALQTYAIGRQKSLYECWLTEAEYHNLCRNIGQMVDENERVLAFKRPSESQCALYGTAKRLQYSPFMMV